MASISDNQNNNGRFNCSSGLWDVDVIPFDEILQTQKRQNIKNLIYCKMDHGIELETIKLKCKAINIVKKCDIGIIPLALSGFRGCLRNVPISSENRKIFKNVNLNEKNDVDNNDNLLRLARTHVIIVGKKYNWEYAPILVLVGLKFRGNVGTIVRTAVQSNYFEAIYIIDAENNVESNNDNANKNEEKKKKWEPKDDAKILNKDIYYYSMLNAPLIPIKRFGTVYEFFSCNEIHSKIRRINISAALTNDSYNLYSDEASSFLKLSNIYLFLGTEAQGLPDTIVKMSKNVQIPSLSSSINVGNAFSIILTCMIMSSLKDENK
jgi:hypothetical protein